MAVPEPEPYVKVDAVAAYLNWAEKTVRNSVYKGFLPHYKFGRNCLRFRMSEIAEWAEAQAVPAREAS